MTPEAPQSAYNPICNLILGGIPCSPRYPAESSFNSVIPSAQVAEEARKELRRRGDTATQTSDARFDERFQLGYGLGSGSAQPWYAQPKAPQLLLSQGNAPDPLGLEVSHQKNCAGGFKWLI